MIEIVNRKHDAINFENRHRYLSFVTFKPKEVYFSAETCRGLGLSDGLFVHFFVEDDFIFFYANTDKDGFKLRSRPHKNSLVIFDSSLVRYLMNKKPFTLPVSFPIQLTNNKMYGSYLVQVLFNKPMVNPVANIVKNKLKTNN